MRGSDRRGQQHGHDHDDDHHGRGRGRDEDRPERDDRDRRLLVDASVLITLAEIDSLRLLRRTAGEVVVPRAVEAEVSADPAQSALEDAVDDGWIHTEHADEVDDDSLADAAAHLGADAQTDVVTGDVALLAIALASAEAVVVSDDKPLRKTCKALSIPLSGSIGVLIRAVERGDLSADGAKSKLLAMDEVGARLSVTLLRRAEAMIEDADDREWNGRD